VRVGVSAETLCAQFHKSLPRKRDTYRPEVQHQRREIRLVRDGRPPLSQLPGTPLRVAADALAGPSAFPGTLFLRSHPVSVAIRGSVLVDQLPLVGGETIWNTSIRPGAETYAGAVT